MRHRSPKLILVGGVAVLLVLVAGCSGTPANPIDWGDGGAGQPNGGSSSGQASGSSGSSSSSSGSSSPSSGGSGGSSGAASGGSSGSSSGSASSSGAGSSSSSGAGSSSGSGGGRDAGGADATGAADSAGGSETGAPDSASVGDSSDPLAAARAQCVQIINQDRASLNPPSPPLQEATAQESCVDGQAKADYTANTAHSAFGVCKEFAQDECPNWPGPPSAIMTKCLAQMWAEGPPPAGTDNHWLNMSNAKYTKVACGFYQTPSGNWWATQDFW